MRPSQLRLILERECLSLRDGHHTPAMIWGPPGVGKSDIVRQIAASHDLPMIDIRLSQLEPSDLRGIPFRQEDRVEWAIPTMLPDAQRHGNAGILFLDEINAAPPSVSAAAYQLILDRCLGNYRVPEEWAILAAGNRHGDRGVTYTMPAPLANRFAHFELDVNLDDWTQWAYHANIDERIIGFLRFRPDLLFDFDATRNPIAFPSPRSWEFAHRALQKFGDLPAVLSAALQSCIGNAAGIELHAFLKHLADLPDIDAILRGESVIIPHSLDLQYAIAAALVKRATQTQTQNNATVIQGRILSFAAQLPQREIAVMLVTDLQRHLGNALFNVPEFAPWAQSMTDVLLAKR
jgi:MoxR-like ATPase